MIAIRDAHVNHKTRFCAHAHAVCFAGTSITKIGYPERIDVNGNYCPSNCKWIERPLQAKNKRNSVKAPDGRLWVDIAKSNGITSAAFRCRVSAGGWSHEEAASIPLGTRRVKRQKDDLGRWLAAASPAWKR